MKTEFDFEEFIKGFYSNEVLKGFILRVRDSNDKDKDDAEEDKESNIAYYNGIKAFDVINYKNLYYNFNNEKNKVLVKSYCFITKIMK